MAASTLQLDFGITRPERLPPVAALWRERNRMLDPILPQNSGLQYLSHRAGKVWCGKGQEPSRGTPQRVQELLWLDFFSDPAQWWDNRRSKRTPRHPDFKHKKSKDALWLHNRNKPAWVDSQLAIWDTGVTRPSGSLSNSVHKVSGRLSHQQENLEVAMCRKRCEDGQLADAVNALTVLVQRGSHIPNNLFYHVLRRCIAQKDLVVGRLIHALTVKSGYEGNVFLATHLIGLYASHGKLDEAMRVFSSVSRPDSYNWASIIFAYARHGEPTQAIGLYLQMRESIARPANRAFVAVLKACARAKDLAAGKDVHAHILASSRKPDMFVQTCLVDMYAKCGSLEDARRVFDQLSQKNVVTWTVMIAGYAQQGMGQEALGLHRTMQQEGTTFPDSVTFVCLLQACAREGPVALHQGKQLHAQIEEQGLQDGVVIGGSLINMYAKCGSLEDAQIVFNSLSQKNVVTWTAMIAGYSQQGMGQEALSLYNRMQQEGLNPPDSVTFVCLLQACASVGVVALRQGKDLHRQIEKQGLQDDVAVVSSLVNMYAKCGSLEDARKVFDRSQPENVVTWNAMITGYSQQGLCQEALTLYSTMQQRGITFPNSVTFGCLLQACASVGVVALHQGKHLHAQIEERGLQDDLVVGGSLVNMYAKCGSLEAARAVFDRLPLKNVVTWNGMIAGYAQQGMGQEALSLYHSMRQEGLTSPNSVTFVCVLQACANVGVVALHQGKQLHAEVEDRRLQHDVVVGSSLVNMYAKFGSLEDAQRVFDSLSQKNVVTWTSMIAGYTQQGMGQSALTLYSSMQHEGIAPPDAVTFICLLQACSSVGVVALHYGKELHAQIEERGLQDDVVVGASLVNMYTKCSDVECAQRVFDRLSQKNVVTWNAMLAGYVQQGMSHEALRLYRSMRQDGVTPPDAVTYVCLLQACAAVAALPLGKQLHVEIGERGLQADGVVSSSLVYMYAKCGSMVDAQQVFNSLAARDIVSWNALIAGYTSQGDSESVFGLIHQMRQVGVQPEGITFVSVLTVCSHVGLVDEGRMYFAAMSKDYGITPTVEHYTCMMDLLGRAGHLDEALHLVKTMPFQPDGAVWRTLLGACQKWSDVDVGRQAFESSVRLDEKHAASYVLMSNIYASARMWEEANEMQSRRIQSGALKQPGRSWSTDMQAFVVGDTMHGSS